MFGSTFLSESSKGYSLNFGNAAADPAGTAAAIIFTT
jgi:hypothetical protein